MRAEVALHGPRTAAVMLHPPPGRWPARERADRLALALGGAALGARYARPSRWEPYRDQLAALATGVAAAGDGPVPGGLVRLDALGPVGPLEVVPWQGPGRLAVDLVVVDAAGGPSPRLPERPADPGPALEVAVLALLLATAVDVDEDRLALAFGIEGMLGWYRDSDRLAAPRDALAYALGHAGARLREVGRALPPGA